MRQAYLVTASLGFASMLQLFAVLVNSDGMACSPVGTAVISGVAQTQAM